jgi:hypothetical protein
VSALAFPLTAFGAELFAHLNFDFELIVQEAKVSSDASFV